MIYMYEEMNHTLLLILVTIVPELIFIFVFLYLTKDKSIKKSIVNELDSISKNFKNYTFTYWNDEQYDQHFITVSPDTFEDDDKFIDMEIVFYKKYPNVTFLNTEDFSYLSPMKQIKTFKDENI